VNEMWALVTDKGLRNSKSFVAVHDAMWDFAMIRACSWDKLDKTREVIHQNQDILVEMLGRWCQVMH
jgi:hypothetical protein